MKRFNIYLLFFLLIISSSVYGQLDEFLIQSYIYNTWPSSHNIETFTKELKDTYKFNSVFVNVDNDTLGNGHYVTREDIDIVYKAADKAGLSIVAGSNTNLFVPYDKSQFNPVEAEADVQKYSGENSYYRNVIGYSVKDEPELEYIEEVAPSIVFLKNHRLTANLLRYANLYGATNFDESTYREDYLQKYVDTSFSNLLSFDHYPIMTKNDRFFHSLYSHALKSVENSIPFIYVLTPFKKGEDFDNLNPPLPNTMGKSIPEFNYVIYCALAYGAKGISYWPGLMHVRKGGNYNFELKFEDGVLKHISDLHSTLARNSDVLLSLNFASAYHVSKRSTLIELYEELEDIFTDGNESMKEPFSVGLTNFANDSIARHLFSDLNCPFYPSHNDTLPTPQELLITFMVDRQENIYFWVVNKSFTKDFSLKGRFRPSLRLEETLAGKTFDRTAIIKLDPGEGKLFKVTSSSLSGIRGTIKQQTYGSSFEGLKRFKELTITNSSNNPQNNPDVIFNSGATSTFVADEIKITSAHFKSGSLVRLKASTPTNVKPNRPRASARTTFHTTSSFSLEDSGSQAAYISPNPIVDNHMNLYLDLGETEEADVIIYDSMGNLLKRLRTSARENYIPLDNPLPGIYFLHINQGNGVTTLKVVKN